jgi:alkanesulfonate monooxygenase SsuD/methylene tetrahydromethanopterin reductase-like flavin-dependent oxidoreductase (luciferase family)
MDFGYFSLTDNHYLDNKRSANECVRDVVDEAIYAEKLGLHSAWIGEHHFNSLGVLSCPDLALAYIAGQTKKIRLAPAVTVLPIHHPIRVAEQWATLDLLSDGRVDFATGRGYDRNEYTPFHAPFDDNVAAFTEGLEIVQRLWSSREPFSFNGKHYSFENIAITPQPVQRPIPMHVAAFSPATVDLAGRFGCGLVIAPFAAAITLGSLQKVADMYREACTKHGNKPGRMTSSYFIHFADTPEERAQALHRQIRYWRECGGTIHIGPRESAPKSYEYYYDFKAKMLKMEPEEVTERAVLLGSAQQITDTLKKMEAVGFNEVILYFNVGLKPHAQVKDEMARFMEEVAPAFR